MKTMDGVVRRLPVKGSDGSPVNRRIPIALLEPPYLKLSVTLNSRVISRLCSGGSSSHML